MYERAPERIVTMLSEVVDHRIRAMSRVDQRLLGKKKIQGFFQSAEVTVKMWLFIAQTVTPGFAPTLTACHCDSMSCALV